MVRAVWYDEPGAPANCCWSSTTWSSTACPGASSPTTWPRPGRTSSRRPRPRSTTSRRRSARGRARSPPPRFDAEATYWNDVLATPDPDLGRRALDPRVDTADTVRSHELLAADRRQLGTAVVGPRRHPRRRQRRAARPRWRWRWRGGAPTAGTADGTAAVREPRGPRPRGRPGARAPRPVPHRRLVHRDLPGPRRSRHRRLGRRPRGGAATGGRGEVGQGAAARPIPSRGLGYGVLRHLDAARPDRGAGTADPVQLPRAASPAAAAGPGNPSPSSVRCARASIPPIPLWHWRSTPSPRTAPTAPRLTVTLAWPGGLLDADDVDELADAVGGRPDGADPVRRPGRSHAVGLPARRRHPGRRRRLAAHRTRRGRAAAAAAAGGHVLPRRVRRG